MHRGSSSKGVPSNGRMGSCSTGRKGVVVTDNDGNESFRSSRRELGDYLIQLSDHKGKSRREEALSALVQALTMELKIEFVEKNFVTLLYQCLCCIRKGSATELELALKIIGLLGMILEDENHAHEVYKDSIPVLSRILESESNKLKILHCLAIVSCFGANHTDETETAMQIMWKFIASDSGNKKHSANVLAAAISGWSFLLSSIEGWMINHKCWQGSISYLLNVREDGDELVCLAATEALALIFEIDCFEKFSTETKESINGKKQELQANITEKLRFLADQASENGEKHKAKIEDVLKFFESGKSLETSTKIGKDRLKLSTWCQRIKLNFLKSFLGEDGFVKHMRMNGNLQAIFEFTPRGKNSAGNQLYIPEREEITVKFFQRRVQQEDDSLLPFTSSEKKQLAKKMTMSSTSSLNKARTQLLNKKRMISQQNKINHYIVEETQ